MQKVYLDNAVKVPDKDSSDIIFFMIFKTEEGEDVVAAFKVKTNYEEYIEKAFRRMKPIKMLPKEEPKVEEAKSVEHEEIVEEKRMIELS